MSQFILEIKNLRTYFHLRNETVKAIDDISFTLHQGETLCIVGESGSGKSVTALSILQLLPKHTSHPTGSILYQNDDILKLTAVKKRDLRSNDIAIIFQDPSTNLDPVFTIGFQLLESLKQQKHLSNSDKKKELLNILTELYIPNPKQVLQMYPHELSGGMQQRMCIAMAMLRKPKVLIADEPTTALDATTTVQILLLIKKLQKVNNTAVLFITHNLAIVRQIADNIIVMRNSKIIEQQENPQLLESPQEAYTHELLNAIPRKEHRDIFFMKSESLRETLFECQNFNVHYPIKKEGILKKTIGYHKAVNNLDLKIYVGETLAVVGESGCGKSSLAKAITQLLDIPHRKSNIFSFQGEQFVYPTKQIPKNIQIIFQNPYRALNPKMSIKDCLLQPLKYHQIYKDEDKMLQTIQEILEFVELNSNILDRYPHEFSGGQKQRICIARSLLLKPKLLICDEITSALDVLVQMQILKLLYKLQRELSLTYLFITHDISIVEAISDRIIVMYLGNIVESGSTTEVIAKPKHPYTKLLLDSIPSISEKKEVIHDLASLNDIPLLNSTSKGCNFHTRCPYKTQRCLEKSPTLETITSNSLHKVACYHKL